MRVCAHQGCTRPTFMDDDRCFDHLHDFPQAPRGFRAAFIASLIVYATILGVGTWAVIMLVNWVTSR